MKMTEAQIMNLIDDLNYKAKAAKTPALKKYYLDMKREYEVQLENIRHE